jgi:putative membrane protein
MSNMEEIRLSELALQQSTNPEVKSFAQMMVTDHKKAGDKLTAILNQKGVTPADNNDKVEKAVRKLSDQDAKDFDKEYVDTMVKDHKDAINLFEREAKHAEDADLKNFAADTLPTLRQHGEHAKSLKDMVK